MPLFQNLYYLLSMFILSIKTFINGVIKKGSIERDPFFILKAKRKKKPLKGAVKDRDGVYGKEKTSLIATSLLRSREFGTQ
ncbi:hypothetical protein PY546_17405 [Providencia stuartii]|nr:hypothetical protein [Providencia stuartii]